MTVLLLVVVPLAMGYAIPGAMAARAVWLAFGALMAYSQASDDELGGAWVLVALVVLVGLLFVQFGHRLRERDVQA